MLQGEVDGRGLAERWAIIRGSGEPTLVKRSSWRVPVAVTGTSDAAAVRALATARIMQFEQLVLYCERRRRKTVLETDMLAPAVGQVGICAGREKEAGEAVQSEARKVSNFVMHSPRRL